MKIGEIESKYIEYLKDMQIFEDYKIVDAINDIEYIDVTTTYDAINGALYNSELMQSEYPDQLDREIRCDQLMQTVETVLENYDKSLKDPSYDVDPEFDTYNEEQERIIEDNRVLVFVPNEDGSLKPMYLDKRFLSGELKL